VLEFVTLLNWFVNPKSNSIFFHFLTNIFLISKQYALLYSHRTKTYFRIDILDSSMNSSDSFHTKCYRPSIYFSFNFTCDISQKNLNAWTINLWLVTDRWFSAGTPISTTNKTDHHDITEISLKVVLSTISIAQFGSK
jgi:hypothetical protein